MSNKIAIIGAGFSGLSLAYHLKDDASITLFEKSRGVGGRMSTRYTENYQFDHGAQFFTARTKRFKQFLKPFIVQGIVQEWAPKVVTLEKGKKPYKRLWYEPHYVAAPKMNSLCKALSTEQQIIMHTHIIQLSKRENGWYLIDTNQTEHGPFDWIVCTAPAPQAKMLFPEIFSGVEILSSTVMNGCFSMMLGLEKKPPVTWGAATVKDSPIQWIAIDSSKPSRKNHTSIIVQSTNEWAEASIEADHSTVSHELTQEFIHLLNIKLDRISYQSLHRWRYANTHVNDDSEDERDGYIIDQTHKLAVCGDWLLQGKVESAYLSARLLAETLGKCL